LESFAAWSGGIDAGLEGGDLFPAANCADGYAQQVGQPPARLEAAGELALAACRRLSRSVQASFAEPDGWADVRSEIRGDLTERRTRAAAPPRSDDLASRVRPLAGGPLEAFCWTSPDWDELSEEWSIIDAEEFRLLGFADRDADRVHLAPEVCEPLRRFFGSNYAPSLNEESLDLAVALVTLAHEAEHLRRPEASEAAVECVAIQRVRDLVRGAGRGAGYENLMSGLAWDVGYPEMSAEYRTAECHDGSWLDVRPHTSVWP
ncbi:MAG: hypothetical protein HOQ03_05995, partial [Thermoleophilia bacterium]|nr:hypothetical protein [Thermoleophilia bacterium]